jgi:hypothetical protein
VNDAAIREPPQHDQRVVRAAAERLRARQHEHEIGIVRRAGLNGSPGEGMKGLEVFAPGGVQRQLLAVLPALARRLRLSREPGAQAHQQSRYNEHHLGL